MSKVLFCSDLHFGHKNIANFRTDMSDEYQNRRKICEDWEKRVTKRDTVYVLGDACFTMDALIQFSKLPGKKILIRGNHDTLPALAYLHYFDEVYGLLKYKEFWLSHAPIHPNELRNKINLHGHVHYATIPDRRYFNCCPENLYPNFGSYLISLEEIRSHLQQP